jgi:head-tail adaptor
MLTDAELAQLRSDIGELLPDTCQIQRSTDTTDDHGNVSEGWTTVATTSCRLDPFFRMASPNPVAAQEKMRNSYRLTIPYDADLRDGDRVLVGGDVYELVELHDDHSDRAVRWGMVTKLQGA